MTFKKDYKLVVLAIDGGGIKGIVPAMILAEIEKRTGRQIHELFDLIAGTSTGGILSLGLVKPDDEDRKQAKYSAEKLAELYDEERHKIFKKKKFLNLPLSLNDLSPDRLLNNLPQDSLLNSLLNRLRNNSPLFELLDFLRSLNLPSLQELRSPRYTRKEKIEVIKKWLGEKTFINEALTEVIITSYAIDERKPFLFTSEAWKEKKSESKNFSRICSGYKMYHAAMATSAAPTFFKPYEPDFISQDMPKNLFVDGGVIANNPTSIAIVEARTTYFKEMGVRIDPDEILVVSLGTGAATELFSKETEEWGLIKWAKPLLNIVFTGQSEIISYQMDHILLDEQYYRFQFDCEKIPKQPSSVQKICYVSEDMDDTSPENIQQLKEAGKQLIKEKSSKLKDLCEILEASLKSRELLLKKNKNRNLA
jgi:uncharacterized protein